MLELAPSLIGILATASGEAASRASLNLWFFANVATLNRSKRVAIIASQRKITLTMQFKKQFRVAKDSPGA